MKKVLIVDDKQENSFLLESQLKKSGYKAVSAVNGTEALNIALKNHFDIIISEIFMPVMDGFTFCDECRKNKSLKNIPFIFYTAAHTSPKDEEYALGFGADKFIAKSLGHNALINGINELLRNVKNDNTQTKPGSTAAGKAASKEYNPARLLELEDKMARAEETEKELRKINTELQNEIAKHKHIEDALRLSEEKFRISFEDASVGMALTSLDGRLILVNNALSGMLGYDKEELLNKYIMDFIHMDDIKPGLIWLGKMLSGEMRTHRFENRLVHKNGDIVYADTSIALIKDTYEVPLFFVTHMVNITDKKLAEELLTISGTRYRGLFESAKDGIIILDAELGIIIDANPFLIDMLGCSYEEIVGKVVWEIKFFKDIVADKNRFLELQQKEYVHFENLPVETVKGSRINVEFVSNVYKVNLDKVIQFNIRDITERIRMEEEVRESEERFRMVFENVFDGICLYIEDPDPYKRKLVECNERYAMMSGRSREELLQIGSTQKLQITLEDTANNKRLESLAKDTSYSGSFSWIRPDGKENVIEYVGRPIKWRGRSYSIGIDRDITERKRTEKELRKFSRAVEQSPVSIIITDRNGIIEYINPKVTEISGYQFSEVIGKNPRIFSSGEQSKNYYQILWDSILSGKEWQGELHNKKKNGELYWESASISPILDEEGMVSHFIAIKENITERKRILKDLIIAKEKAEQSDRLKTEFLAQISHEIRTPVNSIISFTELLMDDYFEQTTGELSDILNSITASGRRITRTVDLILNASEMQIGTYQPSFENINLELKIIDVIQSGYYARAKQKGLQLIFNNNISSPIVYGDDYSVNQILLNIIDNAIKYTDAGEVVILIDRNNENNIFVSVSDTGIGISEDYLPYLFEPFMQEEHGYSRMYEGNGLGLSLVKRYCDLNRITIAVESKKGAGCKFTITFTEK